MKKSLFSLKCCTIALLLVVYTDVESIRTGFESDLTKHKFFFTEKNIKTSMHKVQMTQRGYIQFLRWELPVPEIDEFTFCLWIKSSNLTYSHSFFSYSKNEKERLIRSWISPLGQSIHLEIANVEIFQFPFSVQENRWYHLCQSWQSNDGRYALWIDGSIQTQGYATKMARHVIPSKGDITVGQEYTDFDKGLEDGIEGSILGFNLLLASAFDSQETFFKNNQHLNLLTISPALNENINTPFFFEFGKIISSSSSHKKHKITFEGELTSSYQQKIPIRGEAPETQKYGYENFKKAAAYNVPLGLQLMTLSYSQCEIGRGSPFIGGPLMLISWTRTPVKIFGGAIVKNVKSECGNF